MSQILKDIVYYRGDQLFNGAVDLSWFLNNLQRSHEAAEAFVFHGPQYHGVTQADIGIVHGHQLQDTVTFTNSVIKRCYGEEDQPFTLAIAGYGTGKSHLALTLANLLSKPDADISKNILSNIEAVDLSIGKEIKLKLLDYNKPCLVIVLNGMQNFDLAAEISRQVYKQIRDKNIDTKPLDDLRPRFIYAVKILSYLNDALKKELLDSCEISNLEDVLKALEEQDEHVYSQVHEFLMIHGIPIQVIGGESVKDLIATVSHEYCGKDKPYQSLVFLFDEFGRYIEFATTRSQIAGSGVLQDLYEGIQSYPDIACFIGFIQFELNAYVQRIPSEYKNEILRYITRYQSANKVYLSINLETLIANLIHKQDINKIDSWFNNESAREKSIKISGNINKWFPQSCNHKLWNTPEQFHNVIRKGCWPLSPFSTWFLYHLTASGKHLQERSALALLGDIFQRFSNCEITETDTWSLAPIDLWTDELQQELIGSEEGGQQGSITHAYASVISRYGERLLGNNTKILRAVVLASKMGMQVDDRDEAIIALSELSGLSTIVGKQVINQLQDEYNVLGWDEIFKAFEILGDTASRTQFLSFIKQKVSLIYNEEGKSKLFMLKEAKWCELLKDLDCDFAEENKITTREWHYKGVTSNLEMLEANLKLSADRWAAAISTDEPRGAIIYCYIDQNHDLINVNSEVKKQLRDIAEKHQVSSLPIIVILLYDEEGKLGQLLAEFSVLEEHISPDDSVQFGNLVDAHKEKTYKLIQNQIEDMIKKRHYITSHKQELESILLKRLGTELFTHIYSNVLQFPFDGFSTSRGNAANTCFQLTNELFQGILDYHKILAKPPQDRNRSLTVLNNHWGIFTTEGSISRRPKDPIVRTISEKWDEQLQSDNNHFYIGEAIKEICHPPYGANIASAGLLLGVFIAPRINNLAVQLNGQQFAISQMLQDGIFKGKFLDINLLQNVELIKPRETSSEWESLLDEWENEKSYYGKIECAKRAEELKNRIPVPPPLMFRYEHFNQQSIEAKHALKKMGEDINNALMRLDHGNEMDNVSELSRGASDLLKLKEQMISEVPAWTDHQIDELTPYIEKSKQVIIQIFSHWLSQQSPRGDQPDKIGDFKHWLLNLIGGNLQKLGLIEQYDEIVKRTHELTKRAEITAQVRQLVRDIQSYLLQNKEVLQIVRVAEIRSVLKIGNEYKSQIGKLSSQIKLDILSEILTQLIEFLNNLRNAEKVIMDRASALWETQIHSEKELENLHLEVSTLIKIFEGCEKDLEDLYAMEKALQMFNRFCSQLKDDQLTWAQFHILYEKLVEEIKVSFDKDELPWSVDEILSCFIKNITQQRNEKSSLWINNIKSECSLISTMITTDANRLYTKANNPPPYITEHDMKDLDKIIRQVEEHLNKLAIEFLKDFENYPILQKKSFYKLQNKFLKESILKKYKLKMRIDNIIDIYNKIVFLKIDFIYIIEGKI
jgi:hypothetical protein